MKIPDINVLISTVRRGVEYDDSGYVFLLNLKSRKLKKIITTPIPIYPDIDKYKAYGGKRGFRGIRIWEDKIIAATFDRIMFYNLEGNVLNSITNKLFSDLHGIEVCTDGIWVTSTGNDSVFLIGWDGGILKSYFLGEISILSHKIRAIPKSLDYRKIVLTEMMLHPNYISLYKSKAYICCRKPGKIAVIDLRTDKINWLNFIPELSLPHDARIYNLHNTITLEVNETGIGQYSIFSLNDPSVSKHIDLSQMGNMNPNRPASRGRTNWLRGMLRISNNIICFGQSPSKLIIIDKNAIIDKINLDSYFDSAVFDIVRV